ncbi:MAG: hypothetical protein EA370_15970 [Wenzhouxiangella sp.]|nr:MAG: hypothetical protein EA370_15970 [Wenzhouxiangella sp.]
MLMAAAGAAAADEQTLMVWSYRGGPVIEPLLEAFTAQTGLAVEYRVLGGDGIVEAMLDDSQSLPDLVLVVDALRMDTLKQAGRLRPLPAGAVTEIAPKWRDGDGYWTGISWRARSVVRRADDHGPADLDALRQLAVDGQLCIREGAHVYNRGFLSWLNANLGEAAAMAWATAVFDNRAEVEGGDRDQIRAVAEGRCSAAVVNHYYLMRWAASEDPAERAIADGLVFGWPDPSIPVAVNVSAIALPSTGRPAEAADQLAIWLAGRDAQAMYAVSVFEFPLNWPAQQIPLAPGLDRLQLNPGTPWPAELPLYRKAAEAFFDPP